MPETKMISLHFSVSALALSLIALLIVIVYRLPGTGMVYSLSKWNAKSREIRLEICHLPFIGIFSASLEPN